MGVKSFRILAVAGLAIAASAHVVGRRGVEEYETGLEAARATEQTEDHLVKDTFDVAKESVTEYQYNPRNEPNVRHSPLEIHHVYKNFPSHAQVTAAPALVQRDVNGEQHHEASTFVNGRPVIIHSRHPANLRKKYLRFLVHLGKSATALEEHHIHPLPNEEVKANEGGFVGFYKLKIKVPKHIKDYIQQTCKPLFATSLCQLYVNGELLPYYVEPGKKWQVWLPVDPSWAFDDIDKDPQYKVSSMTKVRATTRGFGGLWPGLSSVTTTETVLSYVTATSTLKPSTRTLIPVTTVKVVETAPAVFIDVYPDTTIVSTATKIVPRMEVTMNPVLDKRVALQSSGNFNHSDEAKEHLPAKVAAVASLILQKAKESRETAAASTTSTGAEIIATGVPRYNSSSLSNATSMAIGGAKHTTIKANSTLAWSVNPSSTSVSDVKPVTSPGYSYTLMQPARTHHHHNWPLHTPIPPPPPESNISADGEHKSKDGKVDQEGKFGYNKDVDEGSFNNENGPGNGGDKQSATWHKENENLGYKWDNEYTWSDREKEGGVRGSNIPVKPVEFEDLWSN